MTIEELKAENARLKAEVERLTAFTTRTIIPNEELQAQVARIKAEVGLLKEERRFLNQRLDHFVKQTVENREKVERLTKAGNEMDRALTTYAGNMKNNCFQCQLDWNAAKEGKPRA